jgi:hypothetical protein
MKRILVGLLPALALLAACASSGPEVQKSARWSPYPGCNAKQCQSWYEECSAECVNAHSASVTECENKCRANVSNCESSCAG